MYLRAPIGFVGDLRHRASCVTGWREPPAGRSGTFPAAPAQTLERRPYPPLICGADLGDFYSQAVAGDFQDGCSKSAGHEPGDFVFPGVGLVSRLLLRRDMNPFELCVRPPADRFAVKMDCFGEELVAVPHECVDVDMSDLDWPETPPAAFVSEISRLVRRSDEQALPRLEYFLVAVAWTVALDGPGDESLQRGGLGLVQRRHFGHLDQ